MSQELEYTEDEIASANGEGTVKQLGRCLRFIDYSDGEDIELRVLGRESRVLHAGTTSDAIGAVSDGDVVFMVPNGIFPTTGLRSVSADPVYRRGQSGSIRVLQINCTESNAPANAVSCTKRVLRRFAHILKSRRAIGLGQCADGGSILVALNHLPDSDEMQMLFREVGASLAAGVSQDGIAVSCSAATDLVLPANGFTCDSDASRLGSGDLYDLHRALAARYSPESLTYAEAIPFAEQVLRSKSDQKRFLPKFLADLKARRKRAGNTVAYLDPVRAADFDSLVGDQLRYEDHGRDMLALAATLPQEGDE